MNAHELYEAGQLDEAVEAQTAFVRANPTDVNARGFLCELLCFQGELERADKILETLAMQHPDAAVGIAMFRQMIHAEVARRDFYEQGRPPELLEEANPLIAKHLEGSIAEREGRLQDAAAAYAAAEELRQSPVGECDGAPFDEFRDLDDAAGSLIETLTSTGKYYWIPIDRIELMEFRKPERPRDLIWRRVHMVVTGGPDGEVFIPCLYHGTHKSDDNQLRLGRATGWSEGDSEPTHGVGLRTFLVGEEAKTILELGEVTVKTKPSDANA